MSEQTTHVVSLENRRTLNLMRGIIRGLWILSYDWIEKSLEANEWQPEELYEMKSFSKAVEVGNHLNGRNRWIDIFSIFFSLKFCRMERQAFGSKHYKMDIFSEVGPIFVSMDCKCEALPELIKLCCGKITKSRTNAKIIIADLIQGNSTLYNNMISSNWIFDSISNGKLQKLRQYRLSNAEKLNKKENGLKTTKDT